VPFSLGGSGRYPPTVFMASIARIALPFVPGDPWHHAVKRAIAWGQEQSIEMRDAIVLVPFAQHLPLARREWAKVGGWMPRIETTLTLARSLAPPGPIEAGQITFDAALDRLTARRMLRSQSAAVAWLRRDPRGFDRGVAALVQTAHAMARAAAATPSERRDLYWQRGRSLLAMKSGPGAMESLLARVAFEWAAAGARPATDVLFVSQPSAWIVVQAGGADALSEQLLAAASGQTPCLCLDTDVPIDEPFAAIAHHAETSLAVCTDFEDEAQRTAAVVLAELTRGAAPVALIAQDRLLVRRVRALLSRQNVPMLDETGWKLSTTRAGATVVGLLRAARASATSDDWLDWLKSCAPVWPRTTDVLSALPRLEQTLRRNGWVIAKSVNPALLEERPAALWQAASDVLQRFSERKLQRLTGWLGALSEALQACGAWQSLALDDAGRQVLAALHLQTPPAIDDADTMTMDEFGNWIDDTLEESVFRPESPVGFAEAPVVITPLERAMLRPFAAAVLAGTDEKHLGAAPLPHPLLRDGIAAELGIATGAARRDAETLAFAQLLRCPRVTLLRRVDDGGEPLAASPLLQRLSSAMQHAGREIEAAPDPATTLHVPRRVVPRPLPSAPSLLPAQLSASACEALRACPYRFYALHMLSLRESEELDDEVEKRDYGSWLHEVLHQFHLTRGEPLAADAEEARLHRIALDVQKEMSLDGATFLPYAATFARLAPRYVAWLHARDADGALWLDAELELTAKPEQWAGTEMRGRIDRVDSLPGEEGPVTQLIDYKTGSAQELRKKIKQPQEDTQLAFYAALMLQQSDAPGDVSAMYLALDESEGVKPIEHKDVERTAHQLIEGIGRDLAQLRSGAVMPALGEGRACEFCEARGLCRRDHWAASGSGA
jgi:ATP-dependent helicase/nuclease subunit B